MYLYSLQLYWLRRRVKRGSKADKKDDYQLLRLVISDKF